MERRWLSAGGGGGARGEGFAAGERHGGRPRKARRTCRRRRSAACDGATAVDAAPADAGGCGGEDGVGECPTALFGGRRVAAGACYVLRRPCGGTDGKYGA